MKLNKGSLNCNSKKVGNLSECKKCKNSCAGKAQTSFRMGLNNYKSAHKFFKTKKQGAINYFTDTIYMIIMKGKNDWQFTIIHQCTTNVELRKRKIYWPYRLKTFFPNGLNEREESCL